MTGHRLVWHQFRYDQRTFWRDPATVFFTVALPVIFLFIFVTIFGNETTVVNGREIKTSTYYIPGIVTLAVVGATLVNLAISLTQSRERGTLKRIRITPLPPWVFMAGRVGTCVVVSILLVVIVVGLGRVVYGVAIPTATLPGIALALVAGAASFCCLGFALTAAIPTENAAPAVTNAITLPLFFISGVFIPSDQIPDGMQTVANVFPVKHLFDALLPGFGPDPAGPGIEVGNLAVLAAWGAVGLAVSLRTFRWSPANR